MKVRDLVKFLMDFDMDAKVVVSVGDTFDDIEDLDLSWGGPNCGEGTTKKDVEYIYINNLMNNEKH